MRRLTGLDAAPGGLVRVAGKGMANYHSFEEPLSG